MMDLVAIEPTAVQLSFDYDSLDSDTRTSLQELDAEFNHVLKRSSKEFGDIFLKAKQRLPHGQYILWLTSKGVSQSTAWRCMQIAQGKEIGKSFTMNDLPEDAIEQPVEPVEEVSEVGKFPTNDEKRQTVRGLHCRDTPMARVQVLREACTSSRISSVRLGLQFVV